MKFDKMCKKCKNKSITAKKKGGILMPILRTKRKPGRKNYHIAARRRSRIRATEKQYDLYDAILNLPVQSMDPIKEESEKCKARILARRRG